MNGVNMPGSMPSGAREASPASRLPERETGRGEDGDGAYPDLGRILQAISVEAVSAARIEWPAGSRVGPRRMDASLWIYVREGEGRGWSEAAAGEFEIRPGCLIPVSPGTGHRIEIDRGRDAEVYEVCFSARIFGAINLLSLLGFPPVIDLDEDGSVHSSCLWLAREFARREPGWRVVMAGEIRSVLFRVIRSMGASMRPSVRLASLEEMPRLIPALCYIEDNLHSPALSVGEMSRRACLSESRFRKVFRTVIGNTPLSYVQRRRLELACRMLSTSTESITNIAEMCGFSDTSFFYRAFKGWTGFTPREYRSAPRA